LISSEIRKRSPSCFAGCDFISSVIFESRSEVAHIGVAAFASFCGSQIPLHQRLQLLISMQLSREVTFESGKSVEEIAEGVFDCCGRLKSIYIPASVQGVRISHF
jgi:hypothetical protein